MTGVGMFETGYLDCWLETLRFMGEEGLDPSSAPVQELNLRLAHALSALPARGEGGSAVGASQVAVSPGFPPLDLKKTYHRFLPPRDSCLGSRPRQGSVLMENISRDWVLGPGVTGAGCPRPAGLGTGADTVVRLTEEMLDLLETGGSGTCLHRGAA